MEKNDEKRKKMKIFGFTRKILDDFQGFFFGMCLFPEENQQPVLRGQRFSVEKCQFSLDVKQKHTFYLRKSTNIFFAKVSPFINNYSLRFFSI